MPEDVTVQLSNFAERVRNGETFTDEEYEIMLDKLRSNRGVKVQDKAATIAASEDLLSSILG